MSPPSETPPARRRWPIVLGAFVALGVAIRLALPPVLGWAVGFGGEQLGLHAEVAEVELGLWDGQLSIRGLRAAPLEPGASAASAPSLEDAPLSLARATLQLSWGGLFERRIHLVNLDVENPRIQLSDAPDGGFETPWTLPQSDAAPDDPEDEGPGWAFQIDALRLADLDLSVLDLEDEMVVGIGFDEFTLGSFGLEGDDIALGSIGLLGPTLEIHRDRLFRERAAPPDSEDPGEQAAPTPDAPGPAPNYRIDHARIEGAQLKLLTGGDALDVTLHFDVRDASLREDASFPLELNAEVEDGSLALKGDLGLRPLVFDGVLEWDQLPVPLLVLAGVPEFAPWLEHCRADGRLDIALRGGGEAPDLVVAGEFGVADVTVEAPDGSVAVTWEELRAEVRQIRVPLDGSALPPLDFGQVRLTAPVAAVTLPATEEPASDEAPAEAAGVDDDEGLAIRIARFELVDGQVAVDDPNVEPPLQLRLSDVQLDVGDVRYPSLDAEPIAFAARGQGGGSVRIEGRLGDERELDLTADEIALAPFNGYLADAGYAVGSGAMSVTGHWTSVDGVIDADNQVTLHRFQIDADDPGVFAETFGMDLGLALALLTDLNGDIALPVNVQMAEDFGIDLTPIVRDALIAAVRGALTSPLKIVGSVLPRNRAIGPSIEPLRTEPGGALLTPEASARLPELARLLAARPGIRLELQGGTSPAEDSAELAGARAEAVRRTLIDQYGVSEEQIVIDGDAGDTAGVGMQLRVDS